MTNKINALLTGKTFEQLVEIYEGFTAKQDNFTIENLIIDTMEKVDLAKFIKWSEQY
jgi:hypothetical protein